MITIPKNFGVSIVIYILIISISGLTGIMPVVHSTVTDLIPPIVRHSPPACIMKGDRMVIAAIVEDESDISRVNLWYRVPGQKAYTKVRMERSDSKIFRASIELTKGFKEGIEYYIEATDQSNNEGTDGNKAMPYFVKIMDIPDNYRLTKEDIPDVRKNKMSWWKNPWFWVGVVAVGGAAAAATGSGGDKNNDSGIIIVE